MRNEKKKSLRDQSNWSEYGWREDSLIVHVCVSTCNVVYRKLIYWSDILCCVYIFFIERRRRRGVWTTSVWSRFLLWWVEIMSRNLEEEDETTGYITYGLNASSSSSFVHLVHSNSPKNISRPTTVVVETGTGVEEAHMKQVDNDGVVLQILYDGEDDY